MLTETGRIVFSYADEMFRLGNELQDVLAGHTPGSAMTLYVGIAMVVPKFADARRDASVSSVRNQLQTLRAQLEVYRIQFKGAAPEASALTSSMVDAGLIGREPEWPIGFSIDLTHYSATGLLRLSYDPVLGGELVDQTEVAGWCLGRS